MNRNSSLSLDLLPPGQTAVVKELRSTGAIRRRLLDIGLVEGTKVTCLYKSPCGDPIAYLIRSAVIALRAEDSSKIFMEQIPE